MPLLATCGATSPTSPASPAVILPSLTILAPGLGVPVKFIFPAMKSELLILEVETMTDCAVTSAPLVNTTPDWLMSTICPLAVICPAITEGSAVMTRLSVTALAEGCT